MGKQAIIFGATGAVGRKLLDLCLSGDRYSTVIVVARSEAPVSHAKLNWLQVEFDELENLATIPGLAGGDAYCCLGTTIKAAGSKEKFRKVDFDYVLNSVIFSNKNDVQSFSFISVVGANSKSNSLYTRTKGEVEQAIMAESCKSLRILRPSLLKGAREEFRLKEEIGRVVSFLLMPVFLFGFKKYRAIDIDTLARGLYETANEDISSGSVRIYESDELQAY